MSLPREIAAVSQRLRSDAKILRDPPGDLLVSAVIAVTIGFGLMVIATRKNGMTMLTGAQVQDTDR